MVAISNPYLLLSQWLAIPNITEPMPNPITMPGTFPILIELSTNEKEIAKKKKKMPEAKEEIFALVLRNIL